MFVYITLAYQALLDRRHQKCLFWRRFLSHELFSFWCHQPFITLGTFLLIIQLVIIYDSGHYENTFDKYVFMTSKKRKINKMMRYKETKNDHHVHLKHNFNYHFTTESFHLILKLMLGI